jgi:hypothetical protein
MEIKSVKNSLQPNYPTIELFIRHPELLSQHIPGSWLKNKFVATSLAAFLFSSTGTSTTPKSEKIEIVDAVETNNPNEGMITPATTAQKTTNTKQDSTVTNVAPVFAHGEGRGASGCIVISPPVFISEDEAIKIILDQLRAEGYNFSREKCPTFSFKVLNLANCDLKKKEISIKLEMDAYNANSKWVIQYISDSDFSKFATKKGCFSSVIDYDTKQAAEIINKELKKKRKTNAVVFYDPVTRINLDDGKQFDKKMELAKKESKDLLLAQVNDFINWLKTNKITIE